MIAALNYVSENTDKPFGLNIRVAGEQFDAPALLDAILQERERNSSLKKNLKMIFTGDLS